MPTAASSMPAGTSGREPKRGARRAVASVAVTISAATIGRNARPVRTGE